MNTNSLTIAAQECQISQFSTLQLFEETKRQIKNIESCCIEGQTTKISSSNLKPVMKVQNILKLVTKRIRNSQDCTHRDFIGYLSILCRLTPLLGIHNFSLNFDLRFYRSLKKSILKTEGQWKKSQNLAKSTEFKTLLYIIATFCGYAKMDADSKSHNHTLNWKYILNPQLLAMICNLKLHLEPFSLKYYQTIILYYLQSNPKNLSNSLILNSVSEQLTRAHHQMHPPFVLLYIINKFSARAFNFLDLKVVSQIFLILKQQILQLNQKNNRSYWLLYFCVLEKVLANTEFIYQPGYLQPQEIFGFLQKLEKMKELGIRISRTCKSNLLLYLDKIIQKFNAHDKQAFILTGFQSQQFMDSYISLELLETASKDISIQTIAEIIEHGHVQKLFIKSSSNDDFSQEIVARIIRNIKKCNTNPELAFVFNAIVSNFKEHPQLETRPMKYYLN